MNLDQEELIGRRLGPGGLDPVEVLKSSKDFLAFESRDVEKEAASFAIGRGKKNGCQDSGLWVANEISNGCKFLW